jgi:two-component system response regulator HydG
MSAILILEDELVYQMMLAEVLGEAGYQVTPAHSGNEALKIIQQQQFDLFLIDNRLPGMSGLDFLRAVRGAGNQAPAIIMTAYVDVPTVVESMRLSAADFLVKPFSINALLPMVDRYLHPEANLSDRSQRVSNG